MADSKKKAAAPDTKAAPKAPARSKLAAARKALAAAKALLTQAGDEVRVEAVALTSVDRSETSGNLRVGEASVLGHVLDAAEKHPTFVAGHADSDGGVDPQRFETELLREWLDLHVEYAKATDEFAALSASMVTLLGDTAKFYGARVRKPVLRAYRDLSTLADSNPGLRKDLAEPVAYYGTISRKAARTRSKKRDK